MAENLYQLAQEITDKVMGKGTYVKLNKFDPSKGETRQQHNGFRLQQTTARKTIEKGKGESK